MKMVKLASVAILSMIVWTGCVATTPGVQYGDATAVETLTSDFGSTDLQMIASDMVESLLSFPPIQDLQGRPVMFVDTVKNKTMEHIDTESITDTISTKILRSGKFRLADMTKVDAIREQLAYQDSGMVDPDTAVRFGKQIGAEFMLYGNFSSIEKSAGRVKDVYYKFTLKLMNVETGIVEWADEKEIRKSETRKTFGR